MTAILKRELRSYYTSMTGYIIAAFLLLFIGIYTMAINLSYGYPNFEYVLDAMTFVYMILIPLLTMRLLAEERKQKTDLLLYSLPLSSIEIVLGKFLAACAVLALPLLIAGIDPLILSRFGTVNFATAYAALFAFFLMGCALISVGLFLSALTENQLMAGLLSFFVLLLNYFATGLANYVSSASYASFMVLMILGLIAALLVRFMTKNTVAALVFAVIADGGMLVCYLLNSGWFSGISGTVLNAVSIFSRLGSFINGVFDFRAIVYFLSVIGIFLFLTVQALEKRRWNG